MWNEENCDKFDQVELMRMAHDHSNDLCCSGDLAVQVFVKLLHNLLESLQVVLHIVLGHDQAQVELGEGRLQKLVIHLPDKMLM